MPAPIDPSELLSAADIADLIGVKPSAVANYQTRHPDFPEPVAIVARGYSALWLRRDINAWQAARITRQENRLAERQRELEKKSKRIAAKRKALGRKPNQKGTPR